MGGACGPQETPSISVYMFPLLCLQQLLEAGTGQVADEATRRYCLRPKPKGAGDYLKQREEIPSFEGQDLLNQKDQVRLRNSRPLNKLGRFLLCYCKTAGLFITMCLVSA